MIYCANATTDKLQIITSTVAPIDVLALWVDADTAGLASQAPGRTPTQIVTATTTDVMATPAANKTRSLKQLTARNKSATLPNDITLVYNANAGTQLEIHKVTLQPGETLQYIEGLGFYTLKALPGLDVLKFVTGDVVNSTVTLQDITGLTVNLLAGKRYAFDATIFHISASAANGANFAVNIGAVPTRLIVGNWSGVTNSVTAGVGSLGVVTARATAITAQTTGSAANTMTNIEGAIVPSADGTFALQFSSEVAAAAVTVRGDSWLKIRQE